MKVHRLDLLVLDFENYGVDQIKIQLDNVKDLSASVLGSQTVDIGPWDDDHPLNHRSKQRAEAERLFPSSKGDYDLVDVWLAHGDGGEHHIGPVICVCSSEYLAEAAAKGQGWYGGNGHVSKATALRTSDGMVWLLQKDIPVDLDSVQAARDAMLKQTALSKLTDDEKRVLGL